MDHVAVDSMPWLGFGLSDELGPVDGDWHAHRLHQLLYASSGSLELETEGATWLLPPQRAAAIAAGTRHRVVTSGASLRTVYLDAELLDLAAPVAVFAVSALAREMLLESMRWDGERGPDATGEAWFRALGGLAAEWAAAPGPYRLPRASSPELARGLRFLRRRLAERPTVDEVARAAHLSTRTLTRRFQAELGLTFQQYLLAARMLEAMALLSEPEASVGEVALAVGYRSMGSFSDAFLQFAGERPSQWSRGSSLP